MQTTTDREKRREYRQKILNNIATIASRVDELEKAAAEIRNHLHLHDRYFFQQQANLREDEHYGSNDDLEELYLDTCQMIGQLEKARSRLNTACALTQFYDYRTNAVFEEYAAKEAENL